MEQFRLTKAETLPLTPQLAEEMRDLEPSPTERELDPKRVQHLKDKATDREGSKLVTFNWAKVLFKGKPYRMNGQHSSTMLCELNGEFPENLYAHVDTYEADSEESLAVLFRQFDDRRSSRSPADICGAYQGLEPALAHLPRREVQIAIQGVAWYEKNVSGVSGRAGDDIYEMLHNTKYHPFILWFCELFNKHKTGELKATTIIASIFATFHQNEPAAKAFWHDVARGGDEFNEEAPETVLSQWLLKVKDLSAGHKDKPKPGGLYNGCIQAWNAHREDKTLKSIRGDVKKGLFEVSS